MMLPNVWKLPLYSRHPNFIANPNLVQLARQFCVEESVMGIGWGLDGIADGEADPQMYLRVLERTPEDEIGSPRKSARAGHNAIAHRVQINDFVWCRWRNDIYFLGKIEGEWTYSPSKQFADFDLFQVRPCRWQRIGTSELVPGPVKNAYAGRGSTLSRINNYGEYTAVQSARIWEQRTGEQLVDISIYKNRFATSQLAHDDLEDLVALYLQFELGWSIVPSTAKRSTPFTESVLIREDGARAYWQVKSGYIDKEDLVDIPEEVSKFFLYDSSNETQFADCRIERISSSSLKSFAIKFRSLLPSHLREIILDA